MSSLGGAVRRASFDGGTGRLVVDLPPDGDVRRIVETISDEYDAEFVSKAERKRFVTTAHEFRDGLTQRQRTVLRTAYLADYFESPRGSTAEEVATSLDITDRRCSITSAPASGSFPMRISMDGGKHLKESDDIDALLTSPRD
ncbi:helix-turn-helix domain-containing protein [Haloplanus rubicundus]|uniref:helix-turn-helix domain-containing protein n=1 Tax=Haloplanus rubicundus TaxID=1547898 RepID=UPI001FE782A7|nr:bacterio-opsin activator domain-containing protein [Haloplanus rubicundus]